MCISSHVRRVKTLYKSILRLNRGLPEALQVLGNNYVKGLLSNVVKIFSTYIFFLLDEFKRHKTLKYDSQEVTVFMYEWTEYAINLASQLTVKSIQTDRKIGKDLQPEALEKFRDEQVHQLHELYKTTKALEEESGNKS